MNMMTTPTVTKSNFIKFNVSPEFKELAEQKAKEHGMTVSELGRMLFGAFVTGIAKPSLQIDPSFLSLAEQAKQDHRQGKTKAFESADEAISYLHRLA